MARRVVSYVRRGPVALRASHPALEANAYAVAEDVDLTLVLAGRAVELALAGGEVRPGEVAGVSLPPAASAQDLRGLIESGVSVLIAGEDLAALGLGSGDLVDGVQAADSGSIAEAIRQADAVVGW
ncbi:MAG TPA: DsrE family protein [Egibacteraceae bacterium]|nr:DsrE family protein [Egibacteraceae bacterium]